MKSSSLLAFLCALALLVFPAQAQDAASVNWTLAEAEGVNVSSTEGAATGIPVRSQTLVVRDYTGTLQDGSDGPLGKYQRWWLDGATWPIESAPDVNRYVEFVVTPGPGATFDVTTISLVMNGGGTGELDAWLSYDTDRSFATPTALQDTIDVSRTDRGTFSFTVNEMLSAGDSLYFRVYPWLGGGNTSATRYLLLQNVTISGTSTGDAPPPPPPAYSDYANWSLTSTDTTAVSSTAGVATALPVRSQTLVVRDYTGTLQDGSDGPLGKYQRWWLDGATWPITTGPDPARYVEFVAAPAMGNTLQVTNIDLVMNAGGTGEMDASVFFDTDPAFKSPSPLQLSTDIPRDTVGNYHFTLDQVLNEGDSLFVRIYPWLGGGNESASRYLLLQNVTIGGIGAEIPPPPIVGVNWPLTAADTTAATRNGENLAGNAVRGEGIMIRDYTGTLADGSEGPLGPFQRWWLDANWPDESAANSGRYIEFVASANDGFAFALDSLSLYLNGQGTGNMEASLYYATDPAFSSPVTLVEGAPASRDELGFYSFPLDLIIPEDGALYFRVYPYLPGGSTSAGKYLLLQDVTVAGQAVETYESEGVFWSLTESYGRSVAATGEFLGGTAAQGGGPLVIRDYTGTLEGGGEGPLGPFQRWWINDLWPDESAPDGARYVQFAAGAADGYVFRTDSVSVYVNGGGTGNMEAAIYYSTDATFADSVALVAQMPASRSTLGYVSVPLNVDVPAGDSLYVRVYPYLPGGSTSAGKYLFLQAMTIAGRAIDENKVAVDNEATGRFVLYPGFPNPVRETATLRYELPTAGDVQVHLVNVLGQRVATLVTGPQTAGVHDVTVDASALASGVYFVRLQAGGASASRQIVVTR